jgi:hypothetical protein
VNVVETPEDDTYLPCSQAVHVVLAGWNPYVPGIQRAQVPDEAAPDAVENVPGLHALQATSPASSTYVPGSQGVHTEDKTPGETVPGRHAEHVLFWVAMQSVLTINPDGHRSQAMQAELPVLEAYLPLSQAWQAVVWSPLA